MNYALQHLAHLVQMKNEINRKRRRFYFIANNYKTVLLKPNESKRWDYKYIKHRSFTKAFALKQYRAAQAEMKTMTAQMRELRKNAGARIVWGCSGNIQALRVGEEWYYLKDIARMAELYHADKILLGD